MIPIRCFTCGRLIGDKWAEYERRIKNNESSGEILDDLGMERYCCRRMFISHVELIDELLKNVETAAERQRQLKTL